MTRALLCAVLLLCAARPVAAYNDQQHMGMTAIAYKTMVGAALEDGCSSPIDFDGGTVTEHLRDYPGAAACGTTDAVCRARWDDFLDQNERAIRYLRGVDAGLPRSDTCPTQLVQTGTLGQVPFSVDSNYDRSGECGVSFALIQNPGEKQRRCSAPALLCEERSIYQFLAPEDHTGDLLGYWTTEADHDVSVTAIGEKPILPGVGKTLQTVDEATEDLLGGVLVPFVCGIELLTGGDDCVKDAKSVADAAVPIEDIASLVPVLFPRKAPDFTGLWHFIDVLDPDSPCDDRRGMLYERAGPKRVPDALDLLIIIGTELGQQTVSYDDSTGPKRFNITSPGDGDQPSCQRSRPEWELAPMGHVIFSPVDNLGLYGWKGFVEDPSGHVAKSLGWPLHAIGDSVAPHHVTGTTGYGHRPYEDSAEQNWNRILYQDLATIPDVRVAQYQQLRRIIEHGFAYWQIMNDLRASHPGGASLQAVPIRSFVTRVAQDTYAETTEPDGSPDWPFDPTLSVPYFVDLGLRQSTIDAYKDQNSVDRERALLERGAGASLAFLSAIGQLGAPFAPAPRCGTSDALFECGASSACQGECCVPSVTDCPETCNHADCPAGSIFCPSTCSAGKACDPTGCCVTTACDSAPCAGPGDCPAGSSCDDGCCGEVIH